MNFKMETLNIDIWCLLLSKQLGTQTGILRATSTYCLGEPVNYHL